MKKLTPKEQISKLCEGITNSINRWKIYNTRGCSDPMYPDGVNMNLIRNHIVYFKHKIADLCEQECLQLPPEFYFPTPPYTDSNYFAKPNTDRAKRIMSRPSWRCANHESIGEEYDETKLSFF